MHKTKTKKKYVYKLKNKSINKSIKVPKTCKQFCKNEYVPEMNRVFKKDSDEEARIYGKNRYPYKSPTKKDILFSNKLCLKTFCNNDCSQFIDSVKDINRKNEFLETITDGFSKKYTKSQITKLKNKGALSGCIWAQNYKI